MSLFQAEIRNKVNIVEDSLTSKAFGVLDIIDRRIALLPFLRQCGVDIEEDAVQHLTLSFWQWQGNTEPDVIIKGDNLLLYIEAKLGSPLGEEQLIKEYIDGAKKKSLFYLIAITRDALEPECIGSAKQELSKEFDRVNLSWTRWQDLHTLLRKVKGNLTNGAEIKLVEQLIKLLESQGLRAFDGFDESSTKMSLRPFQSFFENLCLFANEIALRSGLRLNRSIERGPQSSLIDYYKDWFSSWIQFRFLDEKWGKDSHTCIALHIDLSNDEPEISLGYEVSLENGQEINRQILRRIRNRLAREIVRVKNLKIYFEHQGYDMDAFDLQTFEGELVNCRGSVTFYFDILASDLLSDNILDEVLTKVSQLRSFVNNLKLYPTAEEKEQSEQGGELTEMEETGE